MAVANSKTTSITNMDATPAVINPAPFCKGQTEEAIETIEVAAADDDGSVYRFFRIPSNAVMMSISIWNDAITNGTAYEVGIYQTAANGGAVVDADVFAATVSMASARTATPLQALFNTLDIANARKKLWELLALTADPKRDYDLCLTGTTVGTVAGTITMAVRYSV